MQHTAGNLAPESTQDPPHSKKQKGWQPPLWKAFVILINILTLGLAYLFWSMNQEDRAETAYWLKRAIIFVTVYLSVFYFSLAMPDIALFLNPIPDAAQFFILTLACSLVICAAFLVANLVGNAMERAIMAGADSKAGAATDSDMSCPTSDHSRPEAAVTITPQPSPTVVPLPKGESINDDRSSVVPE